MASQDTRGSFIRQPYMFVLFTKQDRGSLHSVIMTVEPAGTGAGYRLCFRHHVACRRQLNANKDLFLVVTLGNH